MVDVAGISVIDWPVQTVGDGPTKNGTAIAVVADYIFSDDFASGDATKTENGFTWGVFSSVGAGTNAVNSNNPQTGTYSIESVAAASPSDITVDSSNEVRFDLGGDYGEIWIEVNIFIPSNYLHRDPKDLTHTISSGSFLVGDTVEKDATSDRGVIKYISGTKMIIDEITPDNSSTFQSPTFTLNNITRAGVASVTAVTGAGTVNNKCLFYINSSTGGGAIFTGFECNPVEGDYGRSLIDYNVGNSNGPTTSGHSAGFADYVNDATDLNSWHTWVVHLKPATTVTAEDGICQVWKNGTKVLDHQNIGNYNNIDNTYGDGYLMGYDNSGYADATTINVDNVKFSEYNIFGVS